MKELLLKLILDFKKTDYRSNKFADKQHENSIRDILIYNGFVKIEKEEENKNILLLLKNKDNKLKTIEQINDKLIFVEQPFGSQMSPDFIISIYGYVLWVECKSGKKGNDLSWNSGYPQKDVLYIYSIKNTGNTTIFMGQDTEIYKNTPDFEEKYDIYDDKIKEYGRNEFNSDFKSENYDIYIRRMLIDKTNWDDAELREHLYSSLLCIIGLKKAE
jgi:hypothetical protein